MCTDAHRRDAFIQKLWLHLVAHLVNLEDSGHHLKQAYEYWHDWDHLVRDVKHSEFLETHSVEQCAVSLAWSQSRQNLESI